METPIGEIVNKCIDDWYQLWIRKWLDFIKLLRHDWDVMTVEDIIERYEKQFNIVQKWL